MRTARVIQGLIIFSALIGVVFLLQVYTLLPAAGLYFVTTGWVLFVVDSILTFYRPKASFYLGFVLAVLALAASLGEPQHYLIPQSGNYLAIATLFLGAGAQILLIVLIPLHIFRQRNKDEWAWPGAESQA